jgi:hypothetical protein
MFSTHNENLLYILGCQLASAGAFLLVLLAVLLRVLGKTASLHGVVN